MATSDDRHQPPDPPLPNMDRSSLETESSSPDTDIAGPCAAALASLAPAQVRFLRRLPKAELHAHLNGCIPVRVLQRMASTRFGYCPDSSLVLRSDDEGEGEAMSDTVRASLAKLQAGVVLNEIHEFFDLFPAIYALTSTPGSLAEATRAVLSLFLDPDGGSDSENINDGEPQPQAAYLELRSTPRATPHMTRGQYVETVLDEIERYPAARAALIVSLDRRMPADVAAEVVQCAVDARRRGRRVVGVDLCGDPLAGDMQEFGTYFEEARRAGLGVTMHVAEVRFVSLSRCECASTIHLLVRLADNEEFSRRDRPPPLVPPRPPGARHLPRRADTRGRLCAADADRDMPDE